MYGFSNRLTPGLHYQFAEYISSATCSKLSCHFLTETNLVIPFVYFNPTFLSSNALCLKNKSNNKEIMNENPLDIGEIKGEGMNMWPKTSCVLCNIFNHLSIFSVETINFDNICLCDFCQQCFTTEQQLNEHIESHLARRQCVCCNKDVIVIGGKLYMLHEPNSNCGDDNVSDKSYLAKINYQSTIVLSEIGAVQPKIEVIETKKACDVIGNKEIIEKKRNLRRRTLKKYASDSSLCSNDQNLQNKKQPRKKSEKKKSTVPSDPPVASKPISIEQQPSNGTKQFDCDSCGQQFKSINRLHYHETAVHKKKPNTECDICGRVCKTLTYLKDHKRTHSTEKQFICSYCGKGFHVKFHLKEHINTHTGLVQFLHCF